MLTICVADCLLVMGGGDGECSPYEEQLPRPIEAKVVGNALYIKSNFEGQ